MGVPSLFINHVTRKNPRQNAITIFKFCHFKRSLKAFKDKRILIYFLKFLFGLLMCVRESVRARALALFGHPDIPVKAHFPAEMTVLKIVLKFVPVLTNIREYWTHARMTSGENVKQADY